VVLLRLKLTESKTNPVLNKYLHDDSSEEFEFNVVDTKFIFDEYKDKIKLKFLIPP